MNSDRHSILEQAEALADQAHGLVHHHEQGLTEDAAFVLQMEALRLTILAVSMPEELIAEVTPEEVEWVRVELFGHSVRYGWMHEVEYAGKTWVELVEPALWDENQDPGMSGPPAQEETRKRYHPNAIYAIAERSEAEVIASLRQIKGLNLITVEEPPAY